jgi:hypothetical protein
MSSQSFDQNDSKSGGVIHEISLIAGQQSSNDSFGEFASSSPTTIATTLLKTGSAAGNKLIAASMQVPGNEENDDDSK